MMVVKRWALRLSVDEHFCTFGVKVLGAASAATA